MKQHTLIVIFLMASVTSIALVTLFGPWFVPINSVLLIGLSMALRDRLHAHWQHKNEKRNMVLLIVSGAGIAYVLGAQQIAVASAAAFLLSMSSNAIAWRLLKRTRPHVQDNASNVVAAAVDSIAFPAFAFGFPLLFHIMLLSFVAQTVGGAFWGWALRSKV